MTHAVTAAPTPHRLKLAAYAVLVERGRDEVQVGLDPRTALVLSGPGYRALLDRLTGPVTMDVLLATGRTAGLPPREVTAAVRRLWEAGLLTDVRAGHTGRTGQRVRLVGAGPVGRALARYLVEAGVVELAVFDPRPPDPDLYPAAGVLPDQASALAAALCPGPAVVVPLDHWSKPETLPVALTVVVADGPEVDRVVTDHLLRLDQPHLLVRSLGDAVWVGPLVLPGRTPCVRCTDLTRTDADPGWPGVLAQIARVRLPLSTLLTGWAAAVTANQALAFLQGGQPETTGATVELTAADGQTRRRTWPSHAACGCRWGLRTEWGA